MSTGHASFDMNLPHESFRLGQGTYLDTPTMGLGPVVSATRMRAAIELWERGTANHVCWERDANSCRSKFAGLLGVADDDIGLLPSIVPAAIIVADAIARGGGTVVAHRHEFRSLLLPFLKRFGDDRMRWVDGAYSAEAFVEQITSETDVVIVSAVASAGGERIDLEQLVSAAASAGAEVVVDASQALGPSTLAVPASEVAAVLTAGYKGLLGPRGVAYAYVRRGLLGQDDATPGPYAMSDTDNASAYGPPFLPFSGARRLDSSPAWLSWVGALPALELLESVSPHVCERHCLALASRLREELRLMGLPVIASDLPSPLVTVKSDAAEAVVASLREHGVRAAARMGHIRFGFHIYNGDDDVDRTIRAMAAAVGLTTVKRERQDDV